MKFPFYYCSNNFDIKSISVIGDFNNWDGSRNILEKYADGTWMTEVELSPGNYRYKFLINGNIYFNDPNALIYTHDDRGSTASLIVIDESNKRVINTQPASLSIESYSFFGVDKELLFCESSERKYYMDKHVRLMSKIRFSGIAGLHTVNAIWYTPNNEIYEVQERVLNDVDKNENNENEALFQININGDTPEGEWRLQIFINGTFTLEESFSVELKQPEVLDETVSDDASIPSMDSEIPNFIIEQSIRDNLNSSEAKTDLQTEAEKEELSGEDLLDLFEDIKESNISDSKKISSPDEVEVPTDSNIMDLFDEIRKSEPSDESPLGMANEAGGISNETEQSDTGIDELLELKEFINSSQDLDKKSETEKSDSSKSDDATDEEDINEIFKGIKDTNG
ncbi:isoamylase early set domain-containing protein [Acetivibrio straminisolvens]|jgi:hypothetical protein|uniref:AMP-activated protein kinase glycogen-binding domain-containing protein n=1 Tax=Acetivibrio straminisolvens JCM 21531 TaxID=1294263 RepID=W4VAF7_9FIRM|nr:isoamylase early set domain-containing protein [Acetivibrio straminisolvens]GAE90395.1 hypothetical protein JCM21531_4004 [Acetivibrio straminisolvens JCM 21531]